LEQAILDAVRSLPPEKQREVLEHVRNLHTNAAPPALTRESGRGLWADLQVDLSADDIDEARREMWKTFPRDEY
jgi:hypothetical protein